MIFTAFQLGSKDGRNRSEKATEVRLGGGVEAAPIEVGMRALEGAG